MIGWRVVPKFKRKNGKVIDCSEYFQNGKRSTKKKFKASCCAKVGGVPMLAGNTPVCWPMKSDALAVHPSQIPEVMERNRKHGLYIEYDPKDGRPILPDQGAKRELLKISKVHDNNGGYGTDHHISEKAPDGPDPRTVAACKFLDSIPVKGL